MPNEATREAIRNLRLVFCLFCGVGRKCDECEVQTAIEQLGGEADDER